MTPIQKTDVKMALWPCVVHRVPAKLKHIVMRFPTQEAFDEALRMGKVTESAEIVSSNFDWQDVSEPWTAYGTVLFGANHA